MKMGLKHPQCRKQPAYKRQVQMNVHMDKHTYIHACIQMCVYQYGSKESLSCVSLQLSSTYVCMYIFGLFNPSYDFHLPGLFPLWNRLKGIHMYIHTLNFMNSEYGSKRKKHFVWEFNEMFDKKTESHK